ncbi:hypothetical protein BTM25_40690 [Actinomadura rubteroloni]|uniref:LppX_LprAFG lipoprotein n=1 Tax=Actinomadura rubteroloni TaxID=1926885 RepID=A0A2P4UK46_9ACTN|nr:LppX_LprAFG lipoprotein [Actinomadura rubteroloni]POM25425.1 hypothetical protein BTM25_40690 [Actinomadura rubteroloni]
MRRRVAVAAGGAALGAALALTGCNADGGGTTGAMKLSANEALLRTSQKTVDADSFKAALTVRDGDGGGEIKGTGWFRLRPQLAFSAKLDGLGFGGAGSGVSAQAIFTGNTLYAKVPQAARFVANGKPWLKIDVAQVQQRTGFDVKGLIAQLQQIDPAEQTKMFTGSKDARRVGEETVDGVKTVHYTGTVTVGEALKRLDAQQQENARKFLPQGATDRKLTFDLWVDGSGLPRKVVTKGFGRSGGAGTAQVLYSDYGKKVSVNPPPADQVGALTLDGLLTGH